MDEDRQEKIHNAIDRAQATATAANEDILTRSQQRLYDAEQDVNALNTEKQRIDNSIISIEEQIAKLEKLLAQDKRNSMDLAIAISANLSLIDSLRKAGIILP